MNEIPPRSTTTADQPLRVCPDLLLERGRGEGVELAGDAQDDDVADVRGGELHRTTSCEPTDESSRSITTRVPSWEGMDVDGGHRARRSAGAQGLDPAGGAAPSSGRCPLTSTRTRSSVSRRADGDRRLGRRLRVLDRVRTGLPGREHEVAARRPRVRRPARASASSSGAARPATHGSAGQRSERSSSGASSSTTARTATSSPRVPSPSSASRSGRRAPPGRRSASPRRRRAAASSPSSSGRSRRSTRPSV